MKVFLIGATGFTGGYLFDLLYEKGYEITCFVRNTSDTSRLQSKAANIVYGDISDYQSLVSTSKNHDVMIFLAGLSEGVASNIVNCCKENGIKRLLFCGSTGIFTELKPSIKEVKLGAESLVKNSGLDYTIIRPTMIYGSARDRNMCKLVKFINIFPVIPVLGNGTYLQQPVYVQDLAKAFLLALENKASINQEYNIAGAEPVTYNEVVDTTSALLNKKVIKLHIPLSLCVMLLGIYEKLPMRPKFSKEQALRLNEHKKFAIKKAQEELGYTPLTFAEGMRNELMEMGYVEKVLNTV